MQRKHLDPVASVIFLCVITLFSALMDYVARLSGPLIFELWPKLIVDFNFLAENYNAEIASDFVTFYVISLPFALLLGGAMMLFIFRARRYVEFQSDFVKEIRSRGAFLIIVRMLIVVLLVWWIFIFPTQFSSPQDMSPTSIKPFFKGKWVVSAVNICFGAISFYFFASVYVWLKYRDAETRSTHTRFSKNKSG